MNIETITIIGANGTMGSNIAGIFASFGNAKVYLVCRTLEKAERAKQAAAESVKAEAIGKNLFPCNYSKLEECVAQSDLIFDSIVKDMDAKLALNKQITKAAQKNAVICTGTSGLSIHKLSEALLPEHQSRFVGMHLFNPPYSLTLCEIISTETTDPTLLNELKEYASRTLRRTVIEVKDTPAFLANRIGFQLINETMQYAKRYQDSGGIDYIDAVSGPYSGRSMAPLRTADFVGIDVHKAIVNNICHHTDDYAHDTFCLPKFAQGLIAQGNFGKKQDRAFTAQLNRTTAEKSRSIRCSERNFQKYQPLYFPLSERYDCRFA